MKVAVCVWGLLRSLQYTHESIQQYVLFPLQNAGFDYEILLHTYSFHGAYTNSRTGEMADAGLMNFSEWRLLQPSYVYVEDQDSFDSSVNILEYASQGDPWNNNHESLRNHIRALNSLYHLARIVELANSDPFYYKALLKQSGGSDSSRRSKRHDRDNQYSFDAVIFIRPDVLFTHYLPVELLKYFDKALFVPDFHRSCGGGQFNDRMAMGDVNSAITYGRRYESARNYSKSRSLRSEDFTYDYLKGANVTVVEFPFRFKRVRVGGAVHSRDANVVLPHEQLALAPFGAMPRETSWPLKLLYKSDVDDPYNIYCAPHTLRINVTEIDMFTFASRGAYSQEEVAQRTQQLVQRLSKGGFASEDAGSGEGRVSRLGGIIDRTFGVYKDIFADREAAGTDDFFMRADSSKNNISNSGSSSGSSSSSGGGGANTVVRSFASSSALAGSTYSPPSVVRRGRGRRGRGRGRGV